MMREKLCLLTLLIWCGVLPVYAQETPELEVAAGYSYTRANVITPNGCCFSLNGGTGSFAWNANHWFGLEGEIGGYHAGNVKSSGSDLTLISYMAGPHLSYRKHERLTPFAHVLVGGGHAGGALYSATPTSPGFGTNDGLNMAAGGGLDMKLSRRVSLRVIQADYFFTRFLNGSNDHQNNLRLTFSAVFRFGAR
jgi:outer membrane immunogenic protein